MPWVAAIAAVGSIAKGIGDRKRSKRQNQITAGAAGMMGPEQVMGGMQQYNPGLFGAVQGGQMPQQPGYGQNMWNLANNPGYIDPQLQNAPFAQSAHRMTNDFVEAQGRLGKSNMRGGLASGYALANLGARTQRDVQTQQQYSLWRENQRRADLSFISNQYNQLMNSTMMGQGQQANMFSQQQAGQNAWGMGANALSSGLSAYGGMGGGGMSNPNQLAGQGIYQWGNNAPTPWPGGQDNMLPGAMPSGGR